jgi:transcriptional regulator with XRE-family HTH domain
MLSYSTFNNLLLEKNVRATDVSKATGISQSTLSDWKRGKSKPKIDKIAALAKYFDVPIETFLKK